MTVQQNAPAIGATPPVGFARLPIELLLVAGAGLVLGGLTSIAQGLLPDALGALANSSTSWTLLAVALVAVCRERPLPSAALGVLALVTMVLGYQLVSSLRGFPTSEELFLLAGVVVGPFVGVAASWLRETGARAALGVGAIAGVAIGEGAYGLLVVAATTGWVVWALYGVVGAALLAVVCLRRLHRAVDVALAAGTTAVVAVAFFAVYGLAGSLPV